MLAIMLITQFDVHDTMEKAMVSALVFLLCFKSLEGIGVASLYLVYYALLLVF